MFGTEEDWYSPPHCHSFFLCTNPLRTLLPKQSKLVQNTREFLKKILILLEKSFNFLFYLHETSIIGDVHPNNDFHNLLLRFYT